MAQPVNCPYFFGDYRGGSEIEKCRLIARNRENRRPWRRALCESCPVPAILVETTCAHLALEASVERKLGLFDRVAIYAICTEHIVELKDPRRCPECEAANDERRMTNDE